MAALATVLGMGPRRTDLVVDEEAMAVRMGWAFRARIPRARITAAGPHRPIRYAVGVHWAGRGSWIVNGATRPILDLHLDPPVKARALGVAVRLRRLRVSVAAPAELAATLGHPASR